MVRDVAEYVNPQCPSKHSSSKTVSGFYIMDCRQILIIILSELKRTIKFYSSWNNQKTLGFLIILLNIETN